VVPCPIHQTYDRVAQLYARVRPGYPPVLVDDLVAYGRLSAGDRVLEVGAGTGQATVALADRGLRVVALEPGRAMAALARQATSSRPGVEVVEARFEEWAGEGGFGLVACAQSWHWLDPATRLSRAHRLLVPGGALALWWHRHGLPDPALRESLNAVYRDMAPNLHLRGEPPMPDLHDDVGLELTGASGFGDVEIEAYPWQQEYQAPDFLDLLRTHSDHCVLDPGGLDRLVEEMGRAIEAGGGTVLLHYVTGLYLARRL
jgi:SAM-dependent methyltransferase